MGKAKLVQRLAIVAVLIGAILVTVVLMRSSEFATVTAQVVSAEETCHFRRWQGPRSNRRNIDSPPLPCDEARRQQQAARDPEVTLQEITFIRLIYRSPVDGNEYTGELRAWRNDYPGVKRGDQIEVRAHKRETARLESADPRSVEEPSPEVDGRT